MCVQIQFNSFCICIRIACSRLYALCETIESVYTTSVGSASQCINSLIRHSFALVLMHIHTRTHWNRKSFRFYSSFNLSLVSNSRKKEKKTNVTNSEKIVDVNFFFIILNLAVTSFLREKKKRIKKLCSEIKEKINNLVI